MNDQLCDGQRQLAVAQSQDVHHAIAPDRGQDAILLFDYDPDLPPIYSAPIYELLSPEFGHQLAIRLLNHGITRTGGAAWLTTTVSGYGGPVRDSFGLELRRYDDFVGRAYGYEKSFSWHTDFKRFAQEPPRQRLQRRLSARLELWDVAFQLEDDPIEIFW